MSFKLDMSKFHKVAHDKSHTTMKHDDGHVIKIAHSALSPKMREQLASLPIHKDKVSAQEKSPEPSPPTPKAMKPVENMADGGEAEPPKSRGRTLGSVIGYPGADETAPLPSPSPKSPDNKAQGGSVKGYAEGGEAEDRNIPYDKLIPQEQAENAPYGTAPETAVPSPEPTTPPPAPEAPKVDPNAEATPVADTGPETPGQLPSLQAAETPGVQLPTVEGAFSKQEQGLVAQQQAESQQAKAQEQALKSDLIAKQQMRDEFEKHAADLTNERTAILKDIRSGAIDPKHFFNSLSTPQKIGTAIGLVLGGVGSGLTGQPNVAAQFFNSQIQRDIDAQKANLGIQENLLSANFRQYNNMRDATDMTRVMQADIISDQLKRAAAQATDPMAKARLLQQSGALDNQYAPLFQQVAMRRALSSPSLQNADPAQFVPFIVPKEHQAQALKEIGNSQAATQNSDSILKAFDRATQENTLLKTGAGLLRTPESILHMRTMMLPIIHDAEGRVNEFEQKTTSDLEPKPGDTQFKIDMKRKALEAFLNQKQQAPTAKAYGIDINRFQSTKGAQAAPVIKHFGGVPYQKVPGGWKRTSE